MLEFNNVNFTVFDYFRYNLRMIGLSDVKKYSGYCFVAASLFLFLLKSFLLPRDIFNILYIFPVLSALCVFLYVFYFFVILIIFEKYLKSDNSCENEFSFTENYIKFKSKYENALVPKEKLKSIMLSKDAISYQFYEHCILLTKKALGKESFKKLTDFTKENYVTDKCKLLLR